jgi:hypothetical protein
MITGTVRGRSKHRSSNIASIVARFSYYSSNICYAVFRIRIMRSAIFWLIPVLLPYIGFACLVVVQLSQLPQVEQPTEAVVILVHRLPLVALVCYPY